MIFLIILLLAAGMDIRTQALDSRFLFVSGLAGILIGGITGFQGRNPIEIAASCSIGVGILLISRLTEGGIGEGDGCFFIISGLFLDVGRNYILFLSGIFAGGIYGLAMTVFAFWKGNLKTKRMPFLPFLIPGGIWAVCFAK